ncbi:MAG: DNA-binding protein Alba [Candidatus Pacearchaeota archaeon]
MTEEAIQEKKEKPETNEIFIGNKPFMKYVIATVMQLKNNKEVVIKARGKFISRGVDVAEVVKKRVKDMKEMNLSEKISIGTEEFKNEEGKNIHVSIIEIALIKE